MRVLVLLALLAAACAAPPLRRAVEAELKVVGCPASVAFLCEPTWGRVPPSSHATCGASDTDVYAAYAAGRAYVMYTNRQGNQYIWRVSSDADYYACAAGDLMRSFALGAARQPERVPAWTAGLTDTVDLRVTRLYTTTGTPDAYVDASPAYSLKGCPDYKSYACDTAFSEVRAGINQTSPCLTGSPLYAGWLPGYNMTVVLFSMRWTDGVKMYDNWRVARLARLNACDMSSMLRAAPVYKFYEAPEKAPSWEAYNVDEDKWEPANSLQVSGPGASTSAAAGATSRWLWIVSMFALLV